MREGQRQTKDRKAREGEEEDIKPEETNQQRQSVINRIVEWRSIGSVYLKMLYVPNININESIQPDV